MNLNCFLKMFSTMLFLLWLGFPAFVWMWTGKIKSRRAFIAVFAITVLADSLIYVSSVWQVDAEIKNELNRYDLDGDGMFSDEEMTPNAAKAMKKFANDTGRSMAPVVAGPASLIWSAMNFGFLGLIRWLRRKDMRQDAARSAV